MLRLFTHFDALIHRSGGGKGGKERAGLKKRGKKYKIK